MLASQAVCWWRPFRTIDAATVLYVDLSESPVRESAALAWLDERERERLERFLFDGPRRRFALCRAALRATITNRLDCENERLDFETTVHDKPVARVDGKPASISFNVSHSGRHGLIAIAPQGRIGVDVEERVAHRNLDLLIQGVFGKTEQAELASAQGYGKLHLFFRLWTIKEALIKAHGMGFSLDVSSFEVPHDMLYGKASIEVQLPQSPEITWQVEDMGNDCFAAAIAYESRTAESTESPVAT